jgi:hypothetical protein
MWEGTFALTRWAWLDDAGTEQYAGSYTSSCGALEPQGLFILGRAAEGG